MSDVPYGARSGSQSTWAPDETNENAGQEKAGVKERVAETASHVGDAGRETAQDAKEKAREVAHEATDQVRGLADRARSELGSQAGSQQQKLASGLRSLGDELSQMAGGTQDPGYASELVNRAGDATKQVAQWFEDREPTAVLHEIEGFARRRPGLFLAMAAGAGLLVGRFLRGAKDASSDSSGEYGTGPGTPGYATGYPATAGYESTGTTEAGGLSGAYPTPATQNLPQDPALPGSAGETPPAFPPTTADGTRPQTFGGDTDVRNP
jgi:ElaB/YqjD/DUF883 family membrane-anchored ribosome-binding protein